MPEAEPEDFGWVRLWVPAHWSTQLSEASWSCQVATVTGFYTDQIYAPAFGNGPTMCPQAGQGDWLLIRHTSSKPPSNAANTTLDGLPAWASPTTPTGAVSYDLPSLETDIIAVGPTAHLIAETAQPSALYDVLTATYPTAIPATWRHVDFEGASARIPAEWPDEQVPSGDEPGLCGSQVFDTPEYLYTDPSPSNSKVVSCGTQTNGFAVKPADGLFLHPSAGPNSAGSSDGEEDSAAVETASFGSSSLNYYPQNPVGQDDSVELNLVVHNRPIEATIGLGNNPALAEALLSSLGVIGRPNPAKGFPGS